MSMIGKFSQFVKVKSNQIKEINTKKIKYIERSVLLDYQLIWSLPLGHGENGKIYNCISKANGQRYALKILSDTEKSRQEITLHNTCQIFENTVNIVDIYIDKGHHPEADKRINYLYMIMELMSGGNLLQYRNRVNVISEAIVKDITNQLVLELINYHKKGIIHKDIKLENILIQKKNPQVQELIKIKICDFGISCEAKSKPTREDYTAYCAAPEVIVKDKRYNHLPSIQDCKPYDERCDIWSLGVVIYCLLSCVPPFYSEINGCSLTPLMYQSIINGQYNFPENDWMGKSDEAKDLIQRILKPNPDERISLQEILSHKWLNQ